MKVSVSDLSGPALDWAVAKCEGACIETLDPITFLHTAHPSGAWAYSADWSQGGPIIERERICLLTWQGEWSAHKTNGPRAAQRWDGETALMAAMRCYVASRLGDEVDVPEELCNS